MTNEKELPEQPDKVAFYTVDEVRFYTIDDLIGLLHWSRAVVQKLFNDPKFPSVDFGKQKVVEKHALIKYFSVKREKEFDYYWQT